MTSCWNIDDTGDDDSCAYIEDEHSDDNSDGVDANGNIHDDDTDDTSDMRLSLVLRWP